MFKNILKFLKEIRSLDLSKPNHAIYMINKNKFL